MGNDPDPNFAEPPTDNDPPVLDECGGDGYQPPSCDENISNRPSESPFAKARWREDFPHQAGQRLRRGLTMFKSQRNAQVTRGESIWGPFLGKGDWNVAQWIIDSGTTQEYTNKLLKLKNVSRAKSLSRIDSQSLHSFEIPMTRHSTIPDLSSKRSTLFRLRLNGLVNSLK